MSHVYDTANASDNSSNTQVLKAYAKPAVFEQILANYFSSKIAQPSQILLSKIFYSVACYWWYQYLIKHYA